MDDSELQKLVEQISLASFSKKFKHKALFNKRLRTTGGRYLTKSHNLEFNIASYNQYGIEELAKIIKHELCHYHLHLSGKPYMHKDKTFRDCLESVGGTRFAKTISQKKALPIKYKIVCKNCNNVYYRKKKIDTKFYRCGKCHGDLILSSIK